MLIISVIFKNIVAKLSEHQKPVAFHRMRDESLHIIWIFEMKRYVIEYEFDIICTFLFAFVQSKNGCTYFVW